ncbi:MAG TPA: sigma factor-like helix-turn-helix DNA-binding protein [Candidatus Acidoferrales bacterium]
MASSNPTNGALAAVTAVTQVQPVAAGVAAALNKSRPNAKGAAPQDTVAISSNATKTVDEQVLLLSAEGESAQAIAALLGISVQAVNSYLS